MDPRYNNDSSSSVSEESADDDESVAHSHGQPDWDESDESGETAAFKIRAAGVEAGIRPPDWNSDDEGPFPGEMTRQIITSWRSPPLTLPSSLTHHHHHNHHHHHLIRASSPSKMYPFRTEMRVPAAASRGSGLKSASRTSQGGESDDEMGDDVYEMIPDEEAVELEEDESCAEAKRAREEAGDNEESETVLVGPSRALYFTVCCDQTACRSHDQLLQASPPTKKLKGPKNEGKETHGSGATPEVRRNVIMMLMGEELKRMRRVWKLGRCMLHAVASAKGCAFKR